MRTIDADALRKKLQTRYDNSEEDFDKGYNIGIASAIELLDTAPTVEEITNDDIQQAIKEGFANGFEMAKAKIINSIAKQYSDHNELVPIWLSIGDIKGGAV